MSSSEQSPAVGACWQPVAATQVSTVQALSSMQLRTTPGLHSLSAQASPVVQASPSVQSFVLAAWAQPVTGTQESSVQISPSSQVSAMPLQPAAVQVSPVVHTSPSSQPPGTS